LFREQQQSSFIYLVLSGTVGLEIELSPQKVVPVQTVGPGEILGWSPMLGLGPMTATARTAERCRLAALPVDRLMDLCEQNPRFGLALMRQLAIALAERLRTTRLRLSRTMRASPAVAAAAHPVPDGAD
jgi:CRP-like cAMP-binding protein